MGHDHFEGDWQWAIFNRHMHRHGWFGATHAKRGDMRPLILKLLLESSMHGYEIIRKFEEKSHGMWRPSPGSIYPTLQLLEEQDMVTSKEVDGKKVYSITEKGKAEAEKMESHPHFEPRNRMDFTRKKELRDIFVESVVILKDIARNGTDSDFEKVKEILAEAKAKLAKLQADKENK